LFGTMDRARFLFRDAWESVRRLVELKTDPGRAVRQPWRYAGAARAAWAMRPRRVSRGPALASQTTIDQLPQCVCWPKDGGAFVTLPLVYSEDADAPGLARSNLGMYRVQLSGGQYEPNREVGLHYQIHRGIGAHHAAAVRRGAPFRVNVFVGGPPSLILSAVMPLPEGMSELAFAGALGGRRVRMVDRPGLLPIHAEADFCIVGTVDPCKLLPEGPFGDHLGYYSLAHDFPVLRVEAVYHRPDPIWPFTVVGRPPQEDTIFGQLIHELTGPIIPMLVPGVKAVHAVDASGVHPLLLAIGSERYTPYAEVARPAELLTQANALLGQGQLSLAKYLWIACGEDDPRLDVHDVAAFLSHMLARLDWTRDLHFQTATTIDTLDYSGTALNEGSKLVIAAVGPPRRGLPGTVPGGLTLPGGFDDPRVPLPGVLVVRGGSYAVGSGEEFAAAFRAADAINAFPLVVLVDDAAFAAATLRNFLWVTFTRSDPAADVCGVESFVDRKHWGCRGSLVIDARIKPHHAPVLEPDAEVSRRVESLAARGGPLHGLF
jgi:4-hydroxy-3-polyprenylbenzoate decarboxylase